MSFADWKKRSKRYHDMMARHGIGRVEAEDVAQDAYKAGERDGIKQVAPTTASCLTGGLEPSKARTK